MFIYLSAFFINTGTAPTNSNDTDYIETKYNDTNINNNRNRTHSNHQSTQFVNDDLKFQLLEELPIQLQNYLNNFEIKEIQIIKNVLLKAKKSFNNTNDTIYRLEDIELEMINVLKRCLFKKRKMLKL